MEYTIDACCTHYVNLAVGRRAGYCSHQRYRFRRGSERTVCGIRFNPVQAGATTKEKSGALTSGLPASDGTFQVNATADQIRANEAI
jgi:hypothetical protein